MGAVVWISQNEVGGVVKVLRILLTFKVQVLRNVVVGKVLVLSYVVGALVWLYRSIVEQ